MIKKRIFTALGIIGFWSILAIASVQQVYDNLPAASTTPFPIIVLRQSVLWLLWIPLTFAILAFTRTFPLERSRLGKSIPVHIVSCAVVCLLHGSAMVAWQHYAAAYSEQLIPASMLRFSQVVLAAFDVLVYGMIVFPATALRLSRRAHEREMRTAHLENQLLQAEFSALKMQMHPHFLFNALNSVATLVREVRTQEAVRAIAQLSDLLRSALDDSRDDCIPLDDELLFLRKYIAIEQIRFGENLRIEWEIAPETASALVPTFIMQPLVENAIKHGLSGRIGSTLLRISAHVEPGKAPKLVLDVEDDGAGLQSNPLTQTASGVGLRNIVSRLRFLYGDNAAFFLTPRLPNGARARVELPLER